MKNFLKWLLVLFAGLVGLTAVFIRILAPRRAKKLAEELAKFRADFEPIHAAIDTQFNQQERVVDGMRRHYIDEGAPQGQVILFLHGLPEGWYSWRYVLPRVDHQYRLIAVDLKGYGRSVGQDENYEWHHVAQQIVDLMSSLKIDQYYVVSHDWGTIIGSVLVSDHPEHILGFVRMEADLIQHENKGLITAYLQKPQWLLFQNNWIATFMMQNTAWFIDLVYSRRMKTPFQQVDRDYLVYEFSRPGVAERVPRYFLHRNWDLDSAIGKICRSDFPFRVLQLQADSDPAQPISIFAEVPTQCPNVQMEWITNASHFDNFDQPAQVAEAINRFVHASLH